MYAHLMYKRHSTLFTPKFWQNYTIFKVFVHQYLKLITVRRINVPGCNQELYCCVHLRCIHSFYK